MNEFLIWSVLVMNALMTVSLWNTMRRGPKRKFLAALLFGKPIAPKHRPPPQGLVGVEFCITDADRRFFDDFDMLREALNQWFENDHPWRLQELPNSELSGLYDSPSYGRRYEIFYNQMMLGKLQVHPTYEYSSATPCVVTEIEMDFARLLPFHDIATFVSFVASFTASGSAEELKNAVASLQHAALVRLWRLEYDLDLDDRSSGGSIDINFDGSAANYLRWRATQRKGRNAT